MYNLADLVGTAYNAASNRWVGARDNNAEINLSSGPITVNPTLLNNFICVNIVANFALTYGNPLNTPPGPIIYVIKTRNSSGGALTTQPAYGAIWHLTGAAPTIGNGATSILVFMYEPTLNIYYEFARSTLST